MRRFTERAGAAITGTVHIEVDSLAERSRLMAGFWRHWIEMIGVFA